MEIKTVYTKERLLKYTAAVMRSRTLLWVTLAICNALVFTCFGLLVAMGAISDTTKFGVLLILVMDVTLLFTSFVLPHFTVPKSKNLNLMVTHTFSPEEIRIEGKNEFMDSSTTVQYPFLMKIIKTGTELYLFISHRQAYIVDLSTLSEEEQTELKELLLSKTTVKSFKWK